MECAKGPFEHFGHGRKVRDARFGATRVLRRSILAILGEDFKDMLQLGKSEDGNQHLPLTVARHMMDSN